MYVCRTDFAPCKRHLRPVSGFAYKIRILRISDLLRMYTTCALKATYAYEVSLLRVTDLLHMYTTCALEVTYCVQGTSFAHKRLIAYVVRLMRSRQIMRMRYDFCA